MWNTLTRKTKILLGIIFVLIIIALLVILSTSRQQAQAIKQAQVTNEFNFLATSQAVVPTSIPTPTLTPTPVLQNTIDATITSQTSNADLERLDATLDILSQEVRLLRNDVEELDIETQKNSDPNEQAIQILVDHIQNLTTLAVSLLVVVPALIERVFSKPKAKGIIAISIISFVITIIGALASQYSVFVVTTTFLYTKIANTTLFIAWGAFLVGIVSLAAFTIVNLFNDGKTNKEVTASNSTG